MSRSLVELADLTQNDLLSGMIDCLKRSDEMVAALILNAGTTDRPTIKYNRLITLPTPVYSDCSTSFSNQAISGGPMTVDLLTLAVQFNTCSIATNLYGSYSDIFQQELEGALKGMSRKIATDAVGSGNGSTAIYGLDSIATNSFTTAVSASLALSDLDRMIDEVFEKESDCYFVGSPATVRSVVNTIRSEAVVNYGELAGTTFRVPTYGGYNILKSASCASGKLWFVNPRTGYKLYFGTSEDNSVGSVFNMQNLGISQSKLESLYRVYAHVAAVGLSPQGVAELTNIL